MLDFTDDRDQLAQGGGIPSSLSPSPSPAPNPFGINLDALKQQSQDAQDQKAQLGILGGVLQNLTSVPTAYENLYLGGKSRGPNVQGLMDAAASTIKDPWDQQKKTYEMYSQAKQNWDQNRQVADQSDLDNKDSAMTKALRYQAVKNGVLSADQANNMNGHQLMQSFNPVSVADESAKQKTASQNAVQQMQLQHQLSLDQMKKQQDFELQMMGIKNALTPPSAEEAKAAGSGQILGQSNQTIKDLANQGYDNTGASGLLNNLHIPFLGDVGPLTDKGKQYADAEDQGVDALAKYRTARGMQPESKDDIKKTYFGQFRDSADVVKAKDLARDQLLAEMQATSGPRAWGQVNKNAGTNIPGPQFPQIPQLSNIPGLAPASPSAGQKTVVSRQVNQKTGQKRLVYSDGTSEVVNPNSFGAGR